MSTFIYNDCTVKTHQSFYVWVNGKDNASSGYLITKGDKFAVTPWKEKATEFTEKKLGSQYLRMYGIEETTKVTVGKLTGYVCE